MSERTWWTALAPSVAADLAANWIPVGLPGFAGEEKYRREALFDDRFGPDGWRLAHIVRGRITTFDEAILEYEQAYRVFLRDRPALVRFLVEACGNVYDWAPENVFDAEYRQPHTAANHYQDISVRRVIAELVDDDDWPFVTDTLAEDATLTDFGTGEVHDLPRARGFRGSGLLQIRGPESPGYVLNPAVVPVHDPALITAIPGRTEWYHAEGCGHLSVEAFWQTSKVVVVRYDRFLALGDARPEPLAGL